MDADESYLCFSLIFYANGYGIKYKSQQKRAG